MTEQSLSGGAGHGTASTPGNSGTPTSLSQDVERVIDALKPCARDCYGCEENCAEAASLLRSQQAQIAALEGERDYAWSEMKNAQAYWRAETAHAEQAEAQIAEARREREALRSESARCVARMQDVADPRRLDHSSNKLAEVRTILRSLAAFLSAHKTEEPK